MGEWQPKAGDRVEYAYNLTGDEPNVAGTVLEVREGPGIDYYLRPLVSLRVEWDPSERVVPGWVPMGRARLLTRRGDSGPPDR